MKYSTTYQENGRFKYLNRHTNLIIVLVGIFLCIYLSIPALNAVHLEGFTAQTQSLAMLLSKAPGIEHDPYLPLVSQFIYQTRSAVVDALALIYTFFPNAGDLAYRGLVLASFFLLLASSIVFGKRWGQMPSVFPFFALLLTPGIPETAFFFNDNIISAALSTTALALISEKQSKIKWLLSGCLMGLAIMSRVDAVFMMPIIAGLILYSYKDKYIRLYACTYVVMTTAIIIGVSAIYHGFSILDIFYIAPKFVMNSNDGQWLSVLLWVKINFIGLSSIPLLIIGLFISSRKFQAQHSHIGLLTFIYYPILLTVFAPKATEVRYIFPILSPMIALHVGTGMQWIYQQFILANKSNQYKYAWVIVIFIFSVNVFPPTQIRMSDGPRLLLGRLWSPIYWIRWQHSVDESKNRSENLVSKLDNQQKNILISTHYNDEFYMRLRLIEAGFIPMPRSFNYPGCNGFSLLQKGRSTIAHIRTDPQYRIAPISTSYNAALQISSSFNCKELQAFNKTFISTFGDNQNSMPTDIYGNLKFRFDRPSNVEFKDLRSSLKPSNSSLVRKYGLLDYTEISTQDINSLILKSKNYLKSHPEYDEKTGSVVTINDYENYYSLTNGPTSQMLVNIRKKLSNEYTYQRTSTGEFN